LADVQVEPDPLVKLLFLRVKPKDGLEQVYRRAIVVALDGLKATFVESDGFEIGRTPGR
jgi:hypothetical protein